MPHVAAHPRCLRKRARHAAPANKRIPLHRKLGVCARTTPADRQSRDCCTHQIICQAARPPGTAAGPCRLAHQLKRRAPLLLPLLPLPLLPVLLPLVVQVLPRHRPPQLVPRARVVHPRPPPPPRPRPCLDGPLEAPPTVASLRFPGTGTWAWWWWGWGRRAPRWGPRGSRLDGPQPTCTSSCPPCKPQGLGPALGSLPCPLWLPRSGGRPWTGRSREQRGPPPLRRPRVRLTQPALPNSGVSWRR